MTNPLYSWLTLHRAQLDTERAEGEYVVEAPKSAAAWRCGPDAPVGGDGFRTGVSDVWGGVGFYRDREAAEATMAQDEADLPFAGQADEVWHGLLSVIAPAGYSSPKVTHEDRIRGRGGVSEGFRKTFQGRRQ